MRLSRFFYLSLLIFFGAMPLSAQKIALLVPDKSPAGQTVREDLERHLSEKFGILDDSLAETVLQNSVAENIFNLSTENAKNFGQALGSDFFLLVKAETLRRSVAAQPNFYIESYAVVYLVSSRSGHLIFWKLETFQSPTAAESEKKLADAVKDSAVEISNNIKTAAEKERRENPASGYEELPAENSPQAKNFRSPIPYRRLKPEYTAAANLYGVTATVDATVDLDESGNVRLVEISRWAGYGLDESVEAAIRRMQWRPAERNGKTLPIRVLLRYNFKKIERDEE